MTGLSSQHSNARLGVSRSSVEEAFETYDLNGAPNGYGVPKQFWVKNPKNNRLYPQKTIYGIAKQLPQVECPSATDTRYALQAAGFEIVDASFEKKLGIDFDCEVKKSAELQPGERRKRLPKSGSKPEKIAVTILRYVRNQHVVAERLLMADGTCGNCDARGPFLKKGTDNPFLEVHHIVPLSEDGDDTLANTIALCPNCHRKAHYG